MNELLSRLKELDDILQLLIDFLESDDYKQIRKDQNAAPGPAVAQPTPEPAAEPAVAAPTPEPVTDLAPSEKTYTLEETRQILGRLVQDGFRADVKAIITSLGAGTLSDLKDHPEKLAAAVAAAEELRANCKSEVSADG